MKVNDKIKSLFGQAWNYITWLYEGIFCKTY